MKFNKFMMVAMFVAAIAMVGCKKDKNEPTNNNQNTEQKGDNEGEDEEEIEDMPTLDAPAAGKVTIAVRAPKTTANGLWLIGDLEDCSWTQIDDASAENQALYAFKRVEGTKTWWVITVNTPGANGFKFLPILKNPEGQFVSGWAVEPTGMRVMLDNEPATKDAWNKDNQHGEDGQVTYFEVQNWSCDPKTVFMPAGKYDFNITLTKPFPAGDVVLAGNFAAKSWGDSDRVMELVEDKDDAAVYSLKGVDVPKLFCFKVFVVDAEGNQAWPDGVENLPLSVDYVKDGVCNATITYPKAEEEE